MAPVFVRSIQLSDRDRWSRSLLGMSAAKHYQTEFPQRFSYTDLFFFFYVHKKITNKNEK